MTRNSRGWRIGEFHGRARLTEAKVRAARAEHMPYIRGRSVGALAKKYNVALATMRDVLNRTTWRHVR